MESARHGARSRGRFLRATRAHGRAVVTVAACHRFLPEEREDGERARRSLEEMRRTGARPMPSDQVFRELGLE